MFEKIKEAPQTQELTRNPLILLNLGRCYFELEQFENAINNFEEAATLFQEVEASDEEIKSLALKNQLKSLVYLGQCFNKVG